MKIMQKFDYSGKYCTKLDFGPKEHGDFVACWSCNTLLTLSVKTKWLQRTNSNRKLS